MQIRHHSSGVANVNFADSERTDVAIHSVDLARVPVNHYDADSSSWSNGELPVK